MTTKTTTFSVTAYTFPKVGVVQGETVASGLTADEVRNQYPDAEFRDPKTMAEDDLIPNFAADPE